MTPIIEARIRQATLMIERLLGNYSRGTFARLMQFELGVPAVLPAARARPDVLYIHIPFCESLCPFCSFHRVRLDTAKAAGYFQSLRTELRLVAERGHRPSVVYVGGGTPTVLPDELGETLALARTLFPVRQISVETNPNHLREAVVATLQAAGVNRLSVGVQSFDDALLRKMGRHDSYGSGQQIIERLEFVAGRFATLNADMIFNLPHQSPASLQRDLQILRDRIGIDQISWYPLMSSKRTARAMLHMMGNVSLERERSGYDMIRSALAHDYHLSSVWCFSRSPGLIDEYIIADTSYLGIGSGAFSYLDGAVYANSFSLRRYVRFIAERGSATTAVRHLTRRERLYYDLLMTLFGLVLRKPEMNRKHHGHFTRLLRKELLLLRAVGAIADHGDTLRLTRNGQYLWVVLLREFFNGVNNFRDQMRHHIRAEQQALGGEPAGR
jgi:coproporphyrinogen III oxidase-like Fe-S oxidoreductase